jgi:hypothetical protein
VKWGCLSLVQSFFTPPYDKSFGNLKKTNTTNFFSGHVRRLIDMSLARILSLRGGSSQATPPRMHPIGTRPARERIGTKRR